MFQCRSCYSVIGREVKGYYICCNCGSCFLACFEPSRSKINLNDDCIREFLDACISFSINNDENSEKEALQKQLKAQEYGYPVNYLFGIAQKVENLLTC